MFASQLFYHAQLQRSPRPQVARRHGDLHPHDQQLAGPGACRPNAPGLRRSKASAKVAAAHALKFNRLFDNPFSIDRSTLSQRRSGRVSSAGGGQRRGSTNR